MILAGALVALLAAPQIGKVEPPSWWPRHSIATVRVLVRGRDLAGARIASAPGLSVVGEPRASASGTSILFDLAVDPAATPGPRRLRLTTPGGAATWAARAWPPRPA